MSMKQKYIDSAVAYFKENGPKFTSDGDPIQYYRAYGQDFEYDNGNGDVAKATIRIGYSTGRYLHKDFADLTSTSPIADIVWDADYRSWSENRLYFARVQNYNAAKQSDPTALRPNAYTIIGAGLLCLLVSTKVLIAAGVGYCIYKTINK